MTRTVLVALAGTFLLGACHPEPPLCPVHLSVSASRTALTVGQSATLTATASDANGNPCTLNSAPTYSSSNAAVASVSGSTVTGVSVGTATITGAVGAVTGSVQITVTAAATATKLALTTSPSNSAQSGAAFAEQPVLQLEDANNNPISQNGVVVTATIASGPSGAALANATATTAANGAASFSGLTLSGVAGTYTLSFEATGLTSVTSDAITLAAVGMTHCGTLSVNETWHAADNPHIVTCNVFVEGSPAPTLTIEAGALVRFDAGVSLSVGFNNGGGLLVQGTAAAPVKFTANASSPPKGFWTGIFLFSNTTATTNIAHTTFEYCGGSGSVGCVEVSGINTRPTLTNVTISNSGNYGLVLDADGALSGSSAALTISGSTNAPVQVQSNWVHTLPVGTYTGNTDDVIEVSASNTVTQTVTWKNLGLPYRIIANVSVEGSSSPVLTIAPGSILRFSAGTFLDIGFSSGGGLKADGGSAATPITFTAQSGTAGGWTGIFFESNATTNSLLNFAVVEFGGAGSTTSANVYVGISPLSITNTTIRNSAACGVTRAPGITTDYQATALGNTFTGNVTDQCQL